MPAVAVVAAGASIATGVAIGATTLAGGLAIAGGVMSGLGAITGNKKLSQVGALVGLGSSAAGLFNNYQTTGSIFGAAGDAATVADTADSLGEAAQRASDLGTAQDAAETTGLLGTASDDTSDALSRATKQAQGGLISTAETAMPQATPATQTPLATPAPVKSSTSVVADAQKAASGDGGLLGKYLGLVKSNPEAAKILASTLGGGAQALGKLEEQRRQANLAAQARDRLNQSILGQRKPA